MVDESVIEDETPAAVAVRLARAKAKNIALLHADQVVIGGDQVAEYDGRIVGKPGTEQRAIGQLKQIRGHTIAFHSAVAVIQERTNRAFEAVVMTRVKLRNLTDGEIEHYVEYDKPLDCAGALRSESRGPLVIEQIHSDDPYALLGLPMLTVAKFLRQLGINPLR